MKYQAFVCREGRRFLVEFPDCPVCQTFAESSDDVAATASEALEGWLEAHLVDGQTPPRPALHARAPAGWRRFEVVVPIRLAAALVVRWARQDAGLTQGELGKKVGVTQQQIAGLENPDANPSVETIRKVTDALGLEATLDVGRRAPLPPLPARSKGGR